MANVETIKQYIAVNSSAIIFKYDQKSKPEQTIEIVTLKRFVLLPINSLYYYIVLMKNEKKYKHEIFSNRSNEH